MSISLMSEVWKLDFPRHIQSLMLALADHASDDGSNIYPSIRYLSWKTGYSDRQVQRLLKILTKDGVLKIVVPATNRYPNQYQMDLSKCRKKKPFMRVDKKSPQVEGDKLMPSAVTNTPLRGDTVMAHKPPNETSNKSPQPQQESGVVGDHKLIYQTNFSQSQKQEISKRLSSLTSSDAQMLLDELGGRMKLVTVKNPLGYLSAMISKFLCGEFTAELGLQIQEGRDAKKKIDEEKNEFDRKIAEQYKVDKTEPTAEFKQVLNEMRRKK